jgi:curli biogenesis system outer membrane secretion channel CsgG
LIFLKRFTLLVFVAFSANGCISITSSDKSLHLIEGPPITDVRTPFDDALSCLSGKISPKVTFSVGAITDATGKEQFTEGGTGKFITQGAGEIVQSALFNAGVNILNRRDPRVLEAEIKWGIRSNNKIIPSRYFITGSINSLDFIPGAGFETQIDGIGPRYRQHRILVGLDLSVTDSSTGRIVANSAIQKQIFADELGVGIGRFFGNILVSLDAANLRREAVSLAMRQMLNLATYDLLTQLMRAENYVACSEGIKTFHNVSLSKAWRAEVSNTNISNGNGNGHVNGNGNNDKKDASSNAILENDGDEKENGKDENPVAKPFVAPSTESSRDEVESLIKNFDIR